MTENKQAKEGRKIINNISRLSFTYFNKMRIGNKPGGV